MSLKFRSTNTTNTTIYTGFFKNGNMYYSGSGNTVDVNDATLLGWSMVNDIIPDFHWKLNGNEQLYHSDAGKYSAILISGNTGMNYPSGSTGVIYKGLKFSAGDFLYSYFPVNMTLSSFTFTCWVSTNGVDQLKPVFCISNAYGGNKIIIRQGPPAVLLSGTTNVVNFTNTNISENDTGSEYALYAFCWSGIMLGEDYTNSTSNLGVMDFYLMSPSRTQRQPVIYTKTEYTSQYGSRDVGVINLASTDKILIGATGYTSPVGNLTSYKLEDMRFYCNRFLTLNEISAIYNEGVGTYQQTYKNHPTTRHPIHWYKLQEKIEYKHSGGLDMFSDSGLDANFLTGDTSSTDLALSITGATFPAHYNWTTCVNLNQKILSNQGELFLSGFTQYSIAFWAKADPGAGSNVTANVVRNNDNTLNVYFNNNTGPKLYYAVSSVVLISGITDANWHHYCLTYRYQTGYSYAAQGNLYMDGTLTGTTTSTGGIFGTRGVKIGGGDSYTTFQAFDIRVYDYALTQNEVEQLYNDNFALMY